MTHELLLDGDDDPAEGTLNLQIHGGGVQS
jgi:hypothetical protein